MYNLLKNPLTNGSQVKINESHHMENAWVFSLILRENVTKHIAWRRAWEIGTHIFPIVWVLSSHPIPSYGVPYHMGNGWIFPLVSHSAGKYIETHRIGKASEIGSHILSIVWVLFSIRFPSYGIPLTHLKLHGFSNKISIAWENAAKLSLWDLRLFFHSIFLPICFRIWWFLNPILDRHFSGLLTHDGGRGEQNLSDISYSDETWHRWQVYLT